jgi:hypothetical protein
MLTTLALKIVVSWAILMILWGMAMALINDDKEEQDHDRQEPINYAPGCPAWRSA